MKLPHSPLWLLAFTLAAVIGVQGAAHGAGPEATASRACNVSTALRAYGPTYTRALSVQRATCKGGKNFIRHWDNCRRANGGSHGRCRRRVLRYRCSEQRYDKLDTQYTATVYCKRSGGHRVKFIVNIYYIDNG